MTRSLRKKHFFAWSVLSMLLPIGMITALLSVEKKVTDSLLQPAKTEVLPIILKQKENSEYAVAVRSNAGGSQLQLEWINKSILKVPTAVIYQSAKNTNEISKAKAVGRIEGRGNFYFTVDSTFSDSNYQLLVYDFIHQKIIKTINF